MVLLSLWSVVASLAVAGGITFLFRSSSPGGQQARALFLLGLVSAVGTVILTFDALSPDSVLRFLVLVLSVPLPGLLYVMAGLGFRRSWRAGPTTLASLGMLTFVGLIFQAGHTLPQGLSLWVGFFYKFAVLGHLAHAISSLWSGRYDDTDVLRRPARHPLTALFSITFLLSLLFNPSSALVAISLVLCWCGIALSIHNTRTRTSARTLDPDDEKLSELRSLLNRRRIYREDDLTLERIGDRLLLSNDEVRRLIHLGLGFRRLADLLDHYRIGAARSILEDADQVEMRLNEVAISVGYRSLAPFEEAFRRLVGESAQEFRRHHLDKANANRPLQLTNSDR